MCGSVYLCSGHGVTHLCSLVAWREAYWRRGGTQFQCKTDLSLVNVGEQKNAHCYSTAEGRGQFEQIIEWKRLATELKDWFHTHSS